MFFYFVYISFSLAFGLKEVDSKLFDELDIDGSLDLLQKIETKESHAYQYLLKKIFKNDTQTSLCHLYACKESDFFDLAISHNAHFTIDFDMEYAETSRYYRFIATKVYEAYNKNKNLFKPKTLFENIKHNLTALQLVEQLVNLITAGDLKAEEEFLKYIQTGQVQPCKYKKVLEFLAKKGNGTAMGILGKMYFDGWGVDKCEDTAMHYFTEGARVKDAGCYTGMGNIFRMKEDLNQARKYYEEGSRRGNPESDYNLFCLYRDKYNAEERGMIYLSIAANKGYLPALYEYGMRLDKQQNYRSAIMYFAPICDYADVIISLQNQAEKYYLSGRFDAALIALLFCAELGSAHSMYNILYMASHANNFKVYDKNKAIYKITKKLTDMGYKTHTVKLGDCYFYGIGVEQSYTDAYAFYLNAALETNTEGFYSLAYLNEHGLGVEKNIWKSLKYIVRIGEIDTNLYLLVWYMGAKLVCKIILGYICTKAMFAIFALLIICGLTFVRKMKTKLKND